MLLPGLWMPALVMLSLALHLSAAGYRVHRFAYAGRGNPEANAERLERFVRSQCDGPAHFVGHSLGGVLAYDVLERRRALACGRVVLLGAPVRGSSAGRRLGAWRIGRWMLGACAGRWQPCEARWRRPEALGIVAGTRPLGLGRVLGRLPGENDGVVCVDETCVDGMTDRALVSLGHSALAFSPRVAALVERFLAQGRFA